MYSQTRQVTAIPFSGRLLMLTLTFIAAAVTAYSLTPLLPSARYTLLSIPPTELPDSLLAMTDALSLPAAFRQTAVITLGLLRGTALEMLLWGMAVVIPARPFLPMVLSLWRGGCFGVVLSMVTAWENGVADSAALFDMPLPMLLYPLGITAVLFLFAVGGYFPSSVQQADKQPQWGIFLRRYLVCSGIVFALTLAGNLLVV